MFSFCIGQTKIFLHFSFFAVLCLFFQLGQSPWGPWCLLAALIHELGHLIAFTLLRRPPRELHFQLNGIRLVPPQTPICFWAELLTLAGGALTSFFCACVLYQAGHPTAAGFHLVTGLFSLLPVQGLDGGEILFLLLEALFPARGRRIAHTVSLFFALAFAAAFLLLGIAQGSLGLLLMACAVLLSGLLQSSTA